MIQNAEAQPLDSEPEESCTVYLAPSTIPGAGLGIFTSIDRANGTVIGTSDVTIPIIDLFWHHTEEEDDLFFWILSEYVWDGKKMCGMHAETELENIDAYVPGLDCAINCHLGLINVDRTLPEYDTTLPHRAQHHGAGSMTPYWSSETVATVSIPAGSELFKYYGDHWFETRPEQFGTIPLTKDYRKARGLLARMDKILRDKLDLREDMFRDLYTIATSFDSRVLNALPRDFSDFDEALEKGLRSTLQQDFMRPNVAAMPESRCLENIVADTSSIEGAGRGAFITRSFAEGETITGSPILHIPDKERLNMYYWDQARGLKDKSKVVGHQLVMNYCWGHEESTLVLCPYGAGVNYINHSREQANVKIQWAPHGQIGQDDAWFHWTLHSLYNAYQPRLAWDYVALRDLEEGEELFLDYGDTWVEEWEHHRKTWVPYSDTDYKSAVEWNEIMEDEEIRTEKEQAAHPYPKNIKVVCHKRVQANIHHIQQRQNAMESVWDISQKGIPCRVFKRETDEDGATSYTVTLQARIGNTTVERTDVHRGWLRFRDQTYSTDIHLRGAFRKEATIPDDMFPPAWRNKRRQHDEL